MRTPGTAEELQRQRVQAISLLKAGHWPSVVAEMLGVSRGAVSRWHGAYQRDGPKGLKAKPHPGPKPKLTARQRQKLAGLLLKGPRWHGYPNELWTLSRVAKVIRKHFGVGYDPSGVWHVLRGMGWSCQKPERRAREGDQKALAQWQSRGWPGLKKLPKKRS